MDNKIITFSLELPDSEAQELAKKANSLGKTLESYISENIIQSSLPSDLVSGAIKFDPSILEHRAIHYISLALQEQKIIS